jgi:hypothetical protein
MTAADDVGGSGFVLTSPQARHHTTNLSDTFEGDSSVAEAAGNSVSIRAQQ